MRLDTLPNQESFGDKLFYFPENSCFLCWTILVTANQLLIRSDSIHDQKKRKENQRFSFASCQIYPPFTSQTVKLTQPQKTVL